MRNCLLVVILSLMVAITFQARILQQNRLLEVLTQEQIIAKIDAKIAEKTAAVNERNDILADVSSAADEAKQLQTNLLNAKLAVETSYRSYYNQKQNCDGLNANLDIVGKKGEVPADQCFDFPVAQEAIQLFVQKSQLKGYQASVRVAQKAYDVQNGFAADATAEQAIYKGLETFFQKKGDSTLQYKYFIQGYNSQNAAYQESQKAVLKKQIIDGANATVIATKSSVDSSENALANKKSACAADLNTLLTDVNSKLTTLSTLQSQLNAKNSIINNGFESLENKQVELKQLTAELKELADQYTSIVAE